jgi:regulator of RNase E activity RraA
MIMALTKEQLEELEQFDTPTVWNALEGFKLRSNITGFSWPGLALVTPRTRPLVGYAVTARVSGLTSPTEEQKAMMFAFYANVRAMDAPAIAVVEDVDEIPIGSFWGEVQATTFKALGAEGTITHGGVRDINEVSSLGFQFFSTCIMVARAESHVIETNCTVRVCGMTVNPGDLIHADLHGAVVIPEEAAPKIAEACRRVNNAELCVLEPCREAIRNGTKPTIDQLRRWRGEMAERR